MPSFEKTPEFWLSFLHELDGKATEETRLDCMGGFAVTQRYGLLRETVDLDVLVIAPTEQRNPLLEFGRRGGELHRKFGVYLDFVGVAKVPEEYESRLTEVFPKTFKFLRLLVLDPYDLALSKLERNIERDRSDVQHLARSVPLDLEVLKNRYEVEMRWQMGNPEREDQTLRLWIEMISEERTSSGEG